MWDTQDSSDTESQRQALLALNNLAVNEINHSSMMGRGIMKVLVDAYSSPDAGDNDADPDATCILKYDE